MGSLLLACWNGMQTKMPYMSNHSKGSFHGFCGFLLTTNVLPFKIFLDYQHRPLTTQSMVPPHLINNKQGVEMLYGMWPTMLPLFKQLLNVIVIFLDRGVGPVHPNYMHYKSYTILLKCLQLSSRFLNWLVEVALIIDQDREFQMLITLIVKKKTLIDN